MYIGYRVYLFNLLENQEKQDNEFHDTVENVSDLIESEDEDKTVLQLIHLKDKLSAASRKKSYIRNKKVCKDSDNTTHSIFQSTDDTLKLILRDTLIY